MRTQVGACPHFIVARLSLELVAEVLIGHHLGPSFRASSAKRGFDRFGGSLKRAEGWLRNFAYVHNLIDGVTMEVMVV